MIRPHSAFTPAILLLVAGLAGCLGGQDAGPQTIPVGGNGGPGESDPEAPAEFGADDGAIEGRVVDDEYNPVEHAAVTLVEREIKTRTAASGRFQFSHVAPGTYTLLGEAPGHEPSALRVVVKAGSKTETGLQLVRIEPDHVPYHVTLSPWNGYYGCGVGFHAAQTADYCGGPTIGTVTLPPIDSNSNWTHSFRGEAGLNSLQTELVWTQTQFLSAKTLAVSFTSPVLGANGTFSNGCGSKGVSPLVRQCVLTPKGEDYFKNATASSRTMDLQVRLGNSQTGPPASFNPTKWLDEQSGVVTQQRFTMYITLFYWGEPMDADFKARPDE
jgi:hypothetical protein